MLGIIGILSWLCIFAIDNGSDVSFSKRGGGKRSGTEFYQPTVAPAPSLADQTAEYQQALPQMFETALQYQPKFDQAQYESYAQLAPQYAGIQQQVLEQYSPEQAAMGENLSGAINQAVTEGLPQGMKDMYAQQFKALAGNQVNAPIGANMVAQNLVGQDMAWRQGMGQLGVSLANQTPVSQAFMPQSGFNVAQSFGQNQNAQAQMYGAQLQAARPMQYTTPGGGVSLGILGQWGGRSS